jgi:hypothetical protein
MGLADSYLDLTVWAWAGAMTVAGLGVLVVYFSDRREMWPLIPAYTLLMIASFLALIELNLLDGSFIATFVLGAIALPFLFVFFLDRAKWWFLIPAYVLLSIGLMIPLVEYNLLRNAFVATYVMGTIALPFIVIYVRERQNWWALIPAYVLLSIGIMVGLIETRLISDLIIPAYVMFTVAIPFLVIYFRNPKEWWPLIPGGVMGLIGVAFLLSERSTRIVAPILFIGIGLVILLRQFLRPKSEVD